MTRPSRLSEEDLDKWRAEHPRWSVVESRLVRQVPISFASGARLISQLVALSDRLDHHPKVTIEYSQTTIELWTHDQGGITALDLEFADGVDAFVETGPPPKDA